MATERRYSKVSRRMWNDRDFRELSAPQPCGQHLWNRLLTGPELTNIPGLIPAWESGMAEALRWPLEGFRKAFAEVFRKGMAKADWDAGLIWVPNAIKHNRPESPNVVKSWKATWDLIPECPLKDEAYRSLKAYLEGLPKAYQEAFAKACGKPSAKACPNQEQEQEQDPTGEEDPQTCQVDAREPDVPDSPPRNRPLDPLAATFASTRADVLQLHEAYRTTFGLVAHKLGGPHSLDYQTLAGAIDTHTLEACLLVLRHAKLDPMVSGRADERGQKHEKIAYIFGNADTFARIHRDALEREGKRRRGRDALDVVAEGKAL